MGILLLGLCVFLGLLTVRLMGRNVNAASMGSLAVYMSMMALGITVLFLARELAIWSPIVSLLVTVIGALVVLQVVYWVAIEFALARLRRNGSVN